MARLWHNLILLLPQETPSDVGFNTIWSPSAAIFNSITSTSLATFKFFPHFFYMNTNPILYFIEKRFKY